ncbi:hypothetical protein B4U80_04214 [Leptotrombidium deliense]|uniref:Uncharacterized protein n=1 Tax=Leptotrombidium deliense TaxID=299467 RepID=A0A443SIP5_9ACAR|nr:hypothetical protein B4U80_04214 [Leptotrombidium deliense]
MKVLAVFVRHLLLANTTTQ